MVGFVMSWYDVRDGRGDIERLMIDHRFQGKGFGRAAVVKVIEILRCIPGCRAVRTWYIPANNAAEHLYASLGFEKTVQPPTDNNEIFVLLKLR